MQFKIPPFAVFVPALFVIIWSTGWIVARYASTHADPFTFLSVRYACAIGVLFIYARFAGVQWPRTRVAFAHSMVSGVLIHALYLGGVWWAIAHGVPASISALLAALQPILTTLFAPWLARERIGTMQWVGVVLGLCGLVGVLAPKLAGLELHHLSPVLLPIGVNCLAMVSVTAGTFYQKRYLHVGDLRVVTILQYVGALALTFPVAILTESLRLEWNMTTIAIMAWSVFGLSIGAIVLLLLLIRRGEVARPAQLIYLVPPLSVLEAWVLFGEALSPVQVGGMAITVIGVALASR